MLLISQTGLAEKLLYLHHPSENGLGRVCVREESFGRPQKCGLKTVPNAQRTQSAFVKASPLDMRDVLD
jgi:hypothetical protein